MKSVNRTSAGAAIFAAARAVDTRLVKARLAAFEQAHRSYADAQNKVDAAETQLRAAQAKLGQCDVALTEVIETLARSLIFDGQQRRNPFAAFGALPPSKVTSLPLRTRRRRWVSSSPRCSARTMRARPRCKPRKPWKKRPARSNKR